MSTLEHFRRLYIDRAHCVYRVYDNSGTCLYIGATDNIPKRRSEHLRTSPWTKDADRFVLTGPLPQVDALDLERREIWRLEPIHNKRTDFRMRDFMAERTGPPAKILTRFQMGALSEFCEYQVQNVEPYEIGGVQMIVPNAEIEWALATFNPIPHAAPERKSYLTVFEAADRIGVSQMTVRRMLKRGAIHSYQKLPGGTGAYLFTGDEVDRVKALRESA